jgi:hypothetical protein
MSKQTDTPRTDEWETYCDESYYHLWRVRRKNERGFNDGFHVHNGDEAKALVDLLNKQDSELTAAREEITILKSKYADHHAEAERLTSEIRSVIEQRDDFRKEVEIVNERLRGKKHPDDNGLTVDGEIDIKQLKEQRDRLAEAMHVINTYDPKNGQCDDGYSPVFHARKALAAVKGGSDGLQG